ncbi:MAG: hypothetical protein K0Q94_5011 [Paenibacillus sp.]|jgi:hypothetical protein|nr:hypothetical protein [Paenibacillus sp.]
MLRCSFGAFRPYIYYSITRNTVDRNGIIGYIDI